jgi:hypothetical protein
MKLEEVLWTLVLVLLALAFLFPKRRSLSLCALAVAIVAIVSLVFIAEHGRPDAPAATAATVAAKIPVDFERFHVEKLDKSDPDAKNRIRVGEIRFDQIRAEAGSDRGMIGTVFARLYNDSALYTLTDYGYNLIVQDCVKTVCTSVFEQNELTTASVPPGQARDVKIAIQDGSTRNTSPIKIIGAIKILLTPTETRAPPLTP